MAFAIVQDRDSGQITGGGQPIPGLRAASGSEIPLFLRWLAAMAARGEGGDTATQGVARDVGGLTDAGEGRGVYA